ncbi:glycosyltransferase [Williamsia serinedens]|uniref:Glycosyltransferase, GT2 family n=1 Tax=Williamsia serinedens TaxID=391736 RepID=A0ABT1H455_9NOCA|nr:Glycosyltransferase, GT2 family [Williamsia serinedens]
MIDVSMVIPTLGSRPEWLVSSATSILEQEGVGVSLSIVCPTGVSLPESVVGKANVSVRHLDEPGLSRAINFGWEESPSARYYAWLGDDDLLTPGGLKAAVRFLDEHPESSACYGNVRYIDGAGRTLFVAHPGRLAILYTRFGKDIVPQPGSLFRPRPDGGPLKLDESLKYGMDLDLFLRLRLEGRVSYLDRELASFRLHQSSITFNNTDRREAESIRMRYLGATSARIVSRMRPFFNISDRLLYRAVQRDRAKAGRGR